MLLENQNPHVDDSAWNCTREIRVGSVLGSGGNEFVEIVQSIIPGTHSQQSYEKSIRVTEVVHHDPSEYTGVNSLRTAERDACGDDSRCTIAQGNLFGRAWGGYSDVVVEHGADGLAIGRETSLINDGADQPALDQVNSKYGHLISPKGSKPITAMIYGTASGKCHLGFPMRTDAFTDDPNDSYLVLYQEGSNSPLFRVHAKTGMVTHMGGREVGTQRVRAVDGTIRDALVLL